MTWRFLARVPRTSDVVSEDEDIVLSSESTEQTQSIAGRLALACREALADTSESLVVGLEGDLGAGKTTFAQGFVHALAGNSSLYVTSPTFAIAQIYETTPRVVHMDLYRLGSLDELETIGYRDLYFRNGIALIEWIDRIPDAIPDQWIEIILKSLPSEKRTIRIRGHGETLLAILRRIFP